MRIASNKLTYLHILFYLHFFKLETVKPWAKIIGNKLLDVSTTIKSPTETCLVILANNSIKTLVTFFSAILFNIPVRIIQHDIYLKTKFLENMLQKANPFAILVTDKMILKDVFFEKYTPNLKLILYTGEGLDGIMPKSLNIAYWDDFMISGDRNPKEHWLNTFPKLPNNRPLVGTIFMHKRSGAPIESLVPTVAIYNSDQLKSAIMAQKKFLAKDFQWNREDKMLIFSAACNIYTIIYQLAALVEGTALAYIEGQDVSFYETMKVLRPTILICDDYTSWLLLSYSKDLGVFSEVTFDINMSAIEQGFLKQTAAIDFLDSVRMVYTYQMIYPYIQATFECDDGRDMDQESCKTLCALTGAAVFHGLVSPMVAGPVCQTTVADYRLVDEPTNLGKHANGDLVINTVSFINFGLPMCNLEFSLPDYPGNQSSEKYRIGPLQVRGSSTCKQSNTWVDTGINVSIGPDSCAKLMLKKRDYPAYQEQMRVSKEQVQLMKLHEKKRGNGKKTRLVKENVNICQNGKNKQDLEHKTGFI